ncbi:hypothetical protein KY329_00215 [Candidatus Woesearchaeota archaeon]|nr:hypothetical protein [Candidatus Woesearchaeota archaeon]
MELKIQMDNVDLGRLVAARPIQCKGASQNSDEIPAFVQVLEAPRSAEDGESYVLCPRLQEFANDGDRKIRCYEGNPAEFNWRSEEQFKAAQECPYFRPKKE